MEFESTEKFQMIYETLKNKKPTPETREELRQLEKQIKHEEKKSHEKGETHHRR